MPVSKWAHTTIRVFVFFSLFVSSVAWGQTWQANRLAPYVTTPNDVVEKMLMLADVGKRDVVYDLGSGDGRIVIRAAQKFGAKAVGVEIDEKLCQQANERIRALGLQRKARVECADMQTADLHDATVVTLYLNTVANAKIKPQLEKQLREGTRIVSHGFEIPGWKPVKTDTCNGERLHHKVYLYVR